MRGYLCLGLNKKRMYFTVRQEAIIHVISLNGYISSGVQIRRLMEKVNDLIYDGHANLVVDLEHLKFISGNGLQALVECRNWTRQHHGDLLLTNVPDGISLLLKAEGLADAFTTAESIEEAKASFHE